MNKDEARDHVAQHMEAIGYDCIPVPETPDHKTADLCARHETGDGDHKRTDEAASLAALQELHPEFTQFFDLGMHRGSM